MLDIDTFYTQLDSILEGSNYLNLDDALSATIDRDAKEISLLYMKRRSLARMKLQLRRLMREHPDSYDDLKDAYDAMREATSDLRESGYLLSAKLKAPI